MHVEDDYFFSYDEVNEYLTEIFKESRVFCKHDIKYRFHPKTDDSAILIDTYHPIGSIGYSPIQALIGGKSLLSNMTEDNMVRNEDVSRAIFEAFHENAHIWQYNVAYMQRKPKNEIFEEMAKTRVISFYLQKTDWMKQRFSVNISVKTIRNIFVVFLVFEINMLKVT